jgi:phosphatidate cytidylyltransferase
MTDSGGGRQHSQFGGRLGADFAARAASAAVMMAAALGFAWLGGFPFMVFWCVVSIGVLAEWRRLVGGEGVLVGVGVGAIALFAASLLGAWGEWPYPELAVLALLAGAVATAALTDADHRFVAGAGVLYAGVLAAGANALRASPQYGFAAILWLFGVVWGADVMAYLGGRLIGGPKLWPRVSPGKTWSGAIVGVVLGAVVGAIVAWASAPYGVSILRLTELGFVLAAASQFGDLFESALKRRAGVKDSGALIPGHGGLMDRLDGFIAATAVALAFAYLRREGDWLASGLLIG